MSAWTVRTYAVSGLSLLLAAIISISSPVLGEWSIAGFWIFGAAGIACLCAAAVDKYDEWVDDEDWDNWFSSLDK